MILMLAGGIGAAKLVLGFYRAGLDEDLTVIGNTGDDLELYGLRVCPDLDTMVYTLSGRVDPNQGWGLAADTFTTLDAIGGLGGEDWFRLGDRDLATHLWRTARLKEGASLADVTSQMCRAFGVACTLLPMTNSFVPTRVVSDVGPLHLQEYLVRERCRPRVCQILNPGIQEARPAPGVEEAILGARAIIVCPSNPFISVGPILSVPGIRDRLRETEAPVVAVTPIVGGTALKGPAARMLEQLGHAVSPTSVAGLYADFLDIFVLDQRDRNLREEIEALGPRVHVLDTVMRTTPDKVALSRAILERL